MTIMAVIFWTSFALVAYTYLGYPAVIWILSRLFPRRESPEVVDAEACRDWPKVSLIIAAYREETVILDRLQNATVLDYPSDKLEIIVGCDGEEDLTGELVRTFGDSRVKLVPFAVRRGKASVLNECVAQASGEVIVFSDANTMMDRDAIKQMARHFADSSVGGVSGQLILRDPVTGSNIDGIYWKYENFLKRCESRIDALLGANGAIYAIRKELYTPIPPDTLIDDFLIGMRIHQHGYRLLYEPRARAHEETPSSIGEEFQRRTRIATGGFQSLKSLGQFVNPLHGRVAFAFLSHKVLRWMCPGFLLAMILTNVALAREPLYLRILFLHEVFYLIATIGLCAALGSHHRWLRIPAMFVSMNAALFCGFFRYATRRQSGTWKRTARDSNRPDAAKEAVQS